MANVAPTTFPEELYESDDFGDFTLICSPEQFKVEVESSRIAFEDPDFDPDYSTWDLIDPETGLYEMTYCQTSDGKHNIKTARNRAEWVQNRGCYRLEPED